MPRAGFSRRKAAASAIAATLRTATKKYAHGQREPPHHTVRLPARRQPLLRLKLLLTCAGFQGDAPFSRGAPQNQFAGRGNWGAAGDAHGAAQARCVTLEAKSHALR